MEAINETNIKTATVRGISFKVLVLSYSAGGKLANVVRADGEGNGRTFVLWTRELA